MIVSKLEERLKTFQRAVDIEEMRRRREEGGVELRKVKRSEHIAKKRALTGKVAQNAGDVGGGMAFGPELISSRLGEKRPALLSDQISDQDRLDQVLNLVADSTDIELLLPAVECIKKALSVELDPPLKPVGVSRAGQRLVQLMTCADKALVFEAVWCVTNICSGPSEIANIMAGYGAIPVLARLLHHESEEIMDQAVWALSNLAGDSVEMRDAVHAAGVAGTVLELLRSTSKLHTGHIANLIWLISNMCRGIPPPSGEFLDSILPVVPQALAFDSEEIKADACWIASFVSDGGDRSRINQIIGLGIVPRLMDLLLSPNPKIQTPAMRAIGNIGTGDWQQTQILLNLGWLDRLSVLLTSRRKPTRKEALWCLSNVAAGPLEHVILLVQSPCIKLAVQLAGDPDAEIKREALWVVSNTSQKPDLVVQRTLLGLNVLNTLVQELQNEDPRILIMVLEGLTNLLKSNKQEGQASEVELAFEKLGGIDHLERLQKHVNPQIYDKVVAMMDEFFGIMEVEDEHKTNLAAMPRGGFAFS